MNSKNSNMNSSWVTISGIVQPGHQIASGRSKQSGYPEGSIKMQKPFFQQLGLDLNEFHEATLNISIAPYRFSLQNPEYTFRNVEWTSLHPPEHFSFSRCKLIFKDVQYSSWIYYPHPETKTTHFQQPSILEAIAPLIPKINYGDKIQILINQNEVRLERE